MPPMRLRIPSVQVRSVVAACAAAALAWTALAPAVGAPSSDPSATLVGGEGSVTAPAVNGPVDDHQVTLITGDVVTWRVTSDGLATATVDSPDTAFETIESGTDFYVIPTDIAPLVGTTLDPELFNIPGLVEQGYDNDASAATPVIVTMDESATAAPALAGLSLNRELTSIGAVAGSVSHEAAATVGAALAEAAVAESGSTTNALPGIEHIRLDRQVEVHLEESVPRTGAPEAWDRGLDGTGVRIAVLDTGIDESHPDIGDAVIAAANFSSDDDTEDHHGHGTHVAATSAGSGDGSDGLRVGVAPGADLINGKVLNAGGSGNESQIIEGMEWAVIDQEADIVNMSLGASATDGTDPMSQAVNTLTAEHGALFVIAAGNSGPKEGTVGSPGAADDALTVGSVNTSGELANSSSRGPRLGDFAIKPEITAPGVDIVAARAEGTSMGVPVDDFYTRASGTSMATPHVSGGAALLLQQHPDWDATQLKSLLVGAAQPAEDLSVYQQGGGELDIAHAIDTDLVATPAALNLGYFQYPHDDVDPVEHVVSYANHGEEVLNVELDLALTDEDGDPAPDSMIEINPAVSTIEPGEVAEVTVTVDISESADSLYEGSLIATDGSGDVLASTPTGLFKEGEMHELTIEGTQADGRPAARSSSVDVVDVHDTTQFLETSVEFTDGVATVRVPPGTYSVMGLITTLDEDDAFYLEQALFGEPEIDVTEDTTLVWDARETEEVTIDAGPDAEVTHGTFGYHRSAQEDGNYTHSWVGSGSSPLTTQPTDPVERGEFEFYLHYVYENSQSDPSEIYDLVFVHPEAIPVDLEHVATPQELTQISSVYHSDVPNHVYGWSRAMWRPYQNTTLNFSRRVEAPREQLEYVSIGDSRFRKTVSADAPFTGQLSEPVTYYEDSTTLTESWFAAPNAPALIEGNEYGRADLPRRDGDELTLLIHEWADGNLGAQPHTGSRDTAVDTADFRLYQDDELLIETGRAAVEGDIAPGPSRLRAELDVARDAPWWQTSTATRTVWEFDTDTTDGETVLPLLQLDYDIDLDLLNSAPRPGDIPGLMTIGLEVRHPAGAEVAPVENVDVWLSYDDGASWLPRPVRTTGDGKFEVAVDRRGGGDYTSIRVHARDEAGNTVQQDVIRAYALHSDEEQ